MKRWIGTLALTMVASFVMAQSAPFTIVRPADGSKVREKVKILIPKNSIPAGGYVAVYLGGEFVEATVPPLQGKYYVYTLDTKGRGIKDGKTNLELVLYVDYNGESRIVDRSSVDVTVANTANIPIPDEGIKLRYRFNPGNQFTYAILQRTALSTISAAQNSLGGRVAELPLDFEKFRMSYSVENAYGNGDGLLRMMPMPLQGKRNLVITPGGSTTPKTFSMDQMAPIYMRVTNTGNEVFGSIPLFAPTMGGIGNFSRTDLYGAFPLPTLPTKPVKPGDVWQTRFQVGHLNLDNATNVQSVVQTFPARGEFVGVEWESGHPCAKIRHTIAMATESKETEKLKKQNAAFSGDRVQLDETLWFALDKGQIIKIVRNQTIDRKVDAGSAPGGGGSAGKGGTPGGGKVGGKGGFAPKGGKMGGGGGMGAPSVNGGSMDEPVPDNQKGGFKPGGGKGGGGMGAPGLNKPGGGSSTSGGGQTGKGGAALGGGGSRGTGGAPTGAQFVRITVQDIFILEQ